MLGTSGRVSGLAFIHILIVYTWCFLPTMSCNTGSGTHDYADGRKHSFVLQWSVYRWEHHQQVAGKDTAVPRIKEGWDVKRNVMYLFDNEASSVQNLTHERLQGSRVCGVHMCGIPVHQPVVQLMEAEVGVLFWSSYHQIANCNWDNPQGGQASGQWQAGVPIVPVMVHCKGKSLKVHH